MVRAAQADVPCQGEERLVTEASAVILFFEAAKDVPASLRCYEFFICRVNIVLRKPSSIIRYLPYVHSKSLCGSCVFGDSIQRVGVLELPSNPIGAFQ